METLHVKVLEPVLMDHFFYPLYYFFSKHPADFSVKIFQQNFEHTACRQCFIVYSKSQIDDWKTFVKASNVPTAKRTINSKIFLDSKIVH